MPRFQRGQHWRPRQPWWDRDWLLQQYSGLQRSAASIAAEYGCTENNILFWLKKHGIQTRTMRETRALKYWGAHGEKNPMFGRCGVLNPNWQGGLTPYRQLLYSAAEWKAFARKVCRRDKACRLCGSRDHLQIHHIEPFSRAPLLVMAIGNVLRLCAKCHRKLRGKELRWRDRLYALVEKASRAACR